MHTWFTLNLGDAMLAAEQQDSIQRQFLAEYAESRSPGGMALFMRLESAGRLHCETILYFSPAAAVLAQQLGADPCAAPAAGDLTLLAGANAAWATCFGNTA